MSLAEPSVMRRRLPFRSLSAAFFAVPVLLAAGPASAQDECESDAECGPGFSCDTVVTSVGTGVAGGGGAAGFAGSGGTGFGGTGSAGAPRGGTAGTSGGGAPPAECNNAICQLGETPETCPNDCKYTTMCAPAECTSDSDCAADYYCPPAGGGGVGTGGGPNVPFCGDLLCTPGTEDVTTCPSDCDPNYRRCTFGYRGCVTNAECPAGYVCSIDGGGSGGTSGAGGSGGAGEAGQPAGGQSSGAAPAATGGIGAAAGTSGTGFGGGAGTGSGAVPNGGSTGEPPAGVCTPEGSTGGWPSGGTAGTGAGTAGTSIGGSGANGPGGGNGGNGGTLGSGPDEDEGDTVVTHGGCSVARPNASSPFALLLFVAAALARFGRRRTR